MPYGRTPEEAFTRTEESRSQVPFDYFRSFAMRAAAPAVLFVGIALSAAHADVTPGGGSSRTDCMVVFNDVAVNQPSKNPRHIRCTDGDPTCDADATVNGVCEFDISVCINSTFNPEKCTVNGIRELRVRHSIDDPDDSKFDPDFQSLQTNIESVFDPDDFDVDDCTPSPTKVQVRIEGPTKKNGFNVCKKNRKIIRIDAESSPQTGGKFRKDRDKLKLTCDPQFPDGCDPQVLFSGTFDRLQEQIFTPTCAVSGCHDSESFIGAGVLLLEEGASHANLVGVQPTNGPAVGEGWLRVDPNSPETSFLDHKLNDSFPGPGFGDRMPLEGKKLDTSLRDIVTLWIAGGAPETGWVPGTD